MDYAEVAVLAPITRAPNAAPTYTYAIPETLAEHVLPGSLVTVPFRARKLSGIVVALSPTSRVSAIKPIESLLDPQPVVDAARIELARWMAHEYLAPLAECLRLFLPPGITVHSDTVYALAATDAPLPTVNNLQADLIALLRQRGELSRGQIQHAFGRKPWRAALDSLVRFTTPAISTPGIARKPGMWRLRIFAPAPTMPTRTGISDIDRTSFLQAAWSLLLKRARHSKGSGRQRKAHAS